MSYYEELRHVAEVNHDDTTEIATLRDSALALQRCRENAEAFRAECAVKGATGEALGAWLRHYSQKLDEREQLLDYQFQVHNKARAHMRDARDEFATLRTELYSELERQHFLSQDTVMIQGHEITGEAYFHGLVAQREQEREAKAREFFDKMNSDVEDRADELGEWNPDSGKTKVPGGVDGYSRPGVPDAGVWGSSGVGAVAGGVVGGAVGAAAGAGAAAGGGRVAGVKPLPGDAGVGAGGSGAGGAGGGRVPGVAPLPGDGSQRPYVRPPAPGYPGSPGYPITSPTDAADLPLTTSPVFSDGMDGGYLPPSVTNASDPRWTAGGAGVGLQSGLAVGSVAAMGGGLLASRGGGLGVSGTTATGAGGVGRGGYGVVPAGGVIGRPAPGTPGATGIPGTGSGGMSGVGAAGSGTAGTGAGAGAGAAGGRAGTTGGAGGPMVAGGMGGAGTPGADTPGARSGRGSLQSSLAQARAAVDRAAGTKPPSSTSVIRPSDGNTSMIGAGQGGRGRDEEERRRRRGYTAPKLDKPDDHQHDAGHWAFGAGSADTLPPVPRTRDDDQW